ncbi:MAG: LemA family protein [Fulvivirga sp.]
MKKGLLITLGIIAVVGFIIYQIFAGSYNTMVNKEENVSNAWANVEAQYQRRADLIPNLVNTVKGFAAQEKEVLTGVVEARSKASSIQIDPSNLDASKIQQFQQAQGQLSGALSRLLVTVERYPDLKSNQNFLDLQAQLEGTENRITVARTRYNEATTDYNKVIRTFPKNMLAGMYGFERKPLFEADQGAENAPAVSF